jgi:phosphoribosylaminoimidazole-succinocarboxamide synthase
VDNLVGEGKTKQVFDLGGNKARFKALENLSAHDGKRKATLEGKGELSIRTTANIFRLLQPCGMPVAFDEQDSPTSFVGDLLDMIKLEVVARNLADGSYLQRNPDKKRGYAFSSVLVEFFLKTKGPRWEEFEDFPCDDPFMRIEEEGSVYLHDAHKTYWKGGHFLRLWPHQAYRPLVAEHLLAPIELCTRTTALILNKACELVEAKHGVKAVVWDFKVEYGLTWDGQLKMGDVLDGESMRLVVDGEQSDKQGFRDGDDLDKVYKSLKRAADLSDLFPSVQDDVVAWAEQNFRTYSTSFPFPK